MVLRSNGGGGRFRLLLGPNLLPRPGVGSASKPPSAIESKPLAWPGACVVTARGRIDGLAKRDWSTLSKLGVSNIAGVLGEPKVGRFSFAACLWLVSIAVDWSFSRSSTHWLTGNLCLTARALIIARTAGFALIASSIAVFSCCMKCREVVDSMVNHQPGIFPRPPTLAPKHLLGSAEL